METERNIDLDFPMDISWDGISFECDNTDEPNRSIIHKREKNQNGKIPDYGRGKGEFINVTITLKNGREYVIARIRIKDKTKIEEQKEEIFERFYKKLNKQMIHITKPCHKAIRCSIVNILSVDTE